MKRGCAPVRPFNKMTQKAGLASTTQADGAVKMLTEMSDEALLE